MVDIPHDSINFAQGRTVKGSQVFQVGLAFTLITCFPTPNALGEETGSRLRQQVRSFFDRYCNDCHADGADEGGFTVSSLDGDLADPATFERWQRLLDRVLSGEMPPADAEPVTDAHRQIFVKLVRTPLRSAHQAEKGTVLRRLNRREYQNTLNDLFGTAVELESQLPEDGRAHEFDNVGEALGISMVHLKQYLSAADTVMSAAIAKTSTQPETQTTTAAYADTREGEQFIGKLWKKLSDGSIVFFQDFGYPSGMLRGTEVRPPGRYRIRVTGYAYQSDQPITFRLGGTSFARGSEKPTYGYFQLPPGPPTTIEVEADIQDRYMIAIDPWGIHPQDYNIRKQGVDGYTGPGLAIKQVELVGPLFDEFPSRGHQLLLSRFTRQELPRPKWQREAQFQLSADDPVAAARETLLELANQAYRRPVENSEIQPYVDLFEEQLSLGQDLEDALRSAAAAILCSPDFLYLIENEGKLHDHALASRLSYFLTRSLPDTKLRQAADNHELTGNHPSILEHAERLLASDASDRLIVDFCDAWLNLRDIEFTSPDQQLFPEFDAFLQDSMLQETRQFVRTAIDENLPVTALIDPGFAMLNNRLALHYGIDGVTGPEIRQVPLPEQSVRGGLLGQASVLKVSANGTNTSPVVRGVWVMDRILGQPPQPPPPGIPGVEPDIRGASTLRELLDKHRDLDSCRGCHAKIDPPGFALECFNPIGGLRERFRSLGEGERVIREVNGRKVRYKLGPPVDCSGQLADGRTFSDYREFKQLILAEPATLTRALATKLLTFATGREMGFSDRDEIEAIVADCQDRGLRDLIERVLLSEIFLNK